MHEVQLLASMHALYCVLSLLIFVWLHLSFFIFFTHLLFLPVVLPACIGLTRVTVAFDPNLRTIYLAGGRVKETDI